MDVNYACFQDSNACARRGIPETGILAAIPDCGGAGRRRRDRWHGAIPRWRQEAFERFDVACERLL
jgi:hypothetical protein